MSPADAKDRIYLVEALGEPDEEEMPEFPGQDELESSPALEPRPYAIVIESSRAHRRVGTAEWGGEGSSLVAFEIPVPEDLKGDPDGDPSEVFREKFRARKSWADAIAGAILTDLLANSAQNDGEGNPYLNANDISFASYPGDPEEEATEDYIGFSFVLNWV